METRNEELEAAILEAPESADAYLVYGDWLMEHGEALGELVSVQATLAKLHTRAGNAREKNALARREKALLAGAEEQLGELRAYEHTWSFGFLEALILPSPSAALYERLLALPAVRFLRELDIEETARSTFALLARFGVPRALRKLALLSDGRANLGTIPAAMWPKLAAIRELTVRGRVNPGNIILPELETLALATPLSEAALETLFISSWPQLRSLHLETPHVTAARLRPLLAKWSDTGTLRHLGIAKHTGGDALLSELLLTGLLPQLTSLDLSRSDVSDRGARVILENAEAFDHLDSLDVSGNDLSELAASDLEKRFELVVDIDEQGATDDDE